MTIKWTNLLLIPLVFVAQTNAIGASSQKKIACLKPKEISNGLPRDAVLWDFGKKTMVSVVGKIIDPLKPSAISNFKESSEVLLYVYASPMGSIILVTRSPIGFSGYEWEEGAPLKPLLNQVLTFTFHGKKIFTPLVDIYAKGEAIYFLTTFHLIRLHRDELTQGIFSPKTTELPFPIYDESKGGYLRAASFWKSYSNRVFIIQSGPNTPYSGYYVNLSFDPSSENPIGSFIRGKPGDDYSIELKHFLRQLPDRNLDRGEQEHISAFYQANTWEDSGILSDDRLQNKYNLTQKAGIPISWAATPTLNSGAGSGVVAVFSTNAIGIRDFKTSCEYDFEAESVLYRGGHFEFLTPSGTYFISDDVN